MVAAFLLPAAIKKPPPVFSKISTRIPNIRRWPARLVSIARQCKFLDSKKDYAVSEIKNIAVIVGSLRKNSINRKVARTLVDIAPASLKLEIIEIGDLPLYNQDFDADSPASYIEFRKKILSADGVLFVTPEHNRSMPAAMKNAIDIGSRPPSKSVWNAKPGAVISASPSLQGGFGANHHLRQSLMCLNVYCMANPETYLSQADKLFDSTGEVSEIGRGFIAKFINAYAEWIKNW